MLLYRQISPAKMKGDVPGISNFKPTDQDAGALSTRREEITAQGAYEAHIATGLRSLGTWGVTVEEADSLDLPAYDDAGIGGSPDYHVSIRFPEPDNRRAVERLAKELHTFASNRGENGWLYRAPNDLGQ